MQLVLSWVGEAILVQGEIKRIGNYGHFVLEGLPLLAIFVHRNAPGPYSGDFLAIYTGWFGQRLEGYCLSINGVTVLESNTLNEVLLWLFWLRCLWQSAILCYLRKLAECPKGLKHILCLSIILQLLFYHLQSRLRCPFLILKLLRLSLNLFMLLDKVLLPAIYLLFMKRLTMMILCPSLDFLLGYSFDYFSLVEKRDSFEVVFAWGTDQGFYRRFFSHWLAWI